MNRKQKNEMKDYVINCFAELYDYDLYSAKNIVEASSFMDTLENNPNYVMHYDDEYWARRIKAEKEEIEKYKKVLVLQ